MRTFEIRAFKLPRLYASSGTLTLCACRHAKIDVRLYSGFFSIFSHRTIKIPTTFKILIEIFHICDLIETPSELMLQT